jgi:hypothetical protein
MTAKRKPKHPPDEDEAQSRRFLAAAAEIEAAGGLSPTEADAEVSRSIGKARAIPPISK